MKIVETTFERLPRERLEIGFEGENQRATVRIDCTSVFAEYPNATPTLIVKPLFADAYPVVVDRNGTDVDWLITSEILSFSGDGEIQLVFYKDQVICKSAVSKIRVSRSLTVTGDMPDPVVQWIENANRKLAEVDAQIVELEGMVDTATDAAERAAESAEIATEEAVHAEGSAETATAKANEATQAAGTATAKAAEAALSATQASNSAMSAAGSESVATAKAAEAAQSAQTAAQKAEQITEAAQIATGKAGEASASATAAHASEINAASSAQAASESETAAKASETAASTSATQAGTSEQNAGTAAQTATQKATEASQSASNAAASEQTATQKAGEAEASAQTAQEAKTAVEQTAEQLADSLEQIDQNTHDIAEHEQYAEATYATKTDLYKKADIIHNTASGAIASFPDGAEMPVDEVTVQINPVQDLHGYDHPWPAGGGKNKFNTDFSDTTINGTAITKLSDGKVSTSGVPTSAFDLVIGTATLPAGDYILNGCPAGGGANKYRLQVTDFPVHSNLGQDSGSGVSFTLSEEMTIAVRIQVYTGASASLTYAPMIRLASETDATFVPYSNICPITGWDGVKVNRTWKNLVNVQDVSGITTQTVIKQDISIPAGQYTISAYVKNDGSAGAGIRVIDKNVIIATTNYATTTTATFVSRQFTLKSATDSLNISVVGSAAGYNASISKVQLEFGSIATDYEPYSGETYDITLPSEAGTVYGGELTVNADGSGSLMVDRAEVDAGTMNWAKLSSPTFWAVPSGMKLKTSNIISSAFHQNKVGLSQLADYEFTTGAGSGELYVHASAYTDAASFKAAMSGVQLVYELATSITYTLTASQIRTLLGQNNIWADTGDVTVKYNADTKRYIDNKITQAIAAALNS